MDEVTPDQFIWEKKSEYENNKEFVANASKLVITHHIMRSDLAPMTTFRWSSMQVTLLAMLMKTNQCNQETVMVIVTIVGH